MRGLVMRGSGRNLEKMDAGVFIEKTAARAVVEGNKIEGNLYGVYIHGAPEAIVRAERDHGPARRARERGRQRRLRVGCARRQGPRQRHPIRARRHLLDRQPEERVQRQPLPRPALCRPLHVHQRRRGLRQPLARQHRRVRRDVLASADGARQRLGRRPRPRLPVQLRQRLADHRQHGDRADAAGGALGRLKHARKRGARARAPAGGGTAADARRAPASARKSASSSTTPTRTGSATTGSRAARSASTSPPARRATRSSATPSSGTATR